MSEVLRTWIYKAPHKTSFYGVTKLYRRNRPELNPPRAASLDAETVFLPRSLTLCTASGEKTVRKTKKPGCNTKAHDKKTVGFISKPNRNSFLFFGLRQNRRPTINR
jgi:hypothetical protein